jgi:hypothetical protein
MRMMKVQQPFCNYGAPYTDSDADTETEIDTYKRDV